MPECPNPIACGVTPVPDDPHNHNSDTSCPMYTSFTLSYDTCLLFSYCHLQQPADWIYGAVAIWCLCFLREYTSIHRLYRIRQRRLTSGSAANDTDTASASALKRKHSDILKSGSNALQSSHSIYHAVDNSNKSSSTAGSGSSGNASINNRTSATSNHPTSSSATANTDVRLSAPLLSSSNDSSNGNRDGTSSTQSHRHRHDVVSSRDQTLPITVLIDSMLYGVSLTLSYLVMLLFMTYNIGVCLMVVLSCTGSYGILTYIYTRRYHTVSSVKKDNGDKHRDEYDDNTVAPPIVNADHCCDDDTEYD